MRRKVEPPSYDVRDLLNVVRCAYYAEHKQPIKEKELIITANELAEKPFQMPAYIRKWLLNCGESECPTIMWLKQFV